MTTTPELQQDPNREYGRGCDGVSDHVVWNEVGGYVKDGLMNFMVIGAMGDMRIWDR